MTTVNAPIDVETALEALEVWIKQRPGLDPMNYGSDANGRAAYRSEVRSIGKQRKEALDALEEARGYKPDAEALEDAFRCAFSGRLSWNGSELRYSTGQYWPTEYRAAAAAVLNAYCSTMRRKHGVITAPHGGKWTIADIKAANHVKGGHFFDRSSMRFFDSKILSTVYQGVGGVFFVTSEQFHGSRGYTAPRKYTVRQFYPESGDICGANNGGTGGRWAAFNELGRYEAQTVARKLAAGESAS